MKKLLLGFVKACVVCCGGDFALALPYGGDLPNLEGKPEVTLRRYDPPRMQLSVNSYLIPNSSIVAFRTGSQDNVAFFGALFGSLAVLAAIPVESSITKSLIQDETLGVDVLQEFENLIKVRPEFINVEREASTRGARLILEPKAFLRIAADEKTSVGVQLDVELVEVDGTVRWRARYEFNPVTQRKLTGSDSWLRNQNQHLREVILAGLSAELNAFGLDLRRQRYPQSADATNCKLLPAATIVGTVQSVSNSFFVTHYPDKRIGTITVLLDPSRCQV